MKQFRSHNVQDIHPLYVTDDRSESVSKFQKWKVSSPSTCSMNKFEAEIAKTVCYAECTHKPEDVIDVTARLHKKNKKAHPCAICGVIDHLGQGVFRRRLKAGPLEGLARRRTSYLYHLTL